MNCRAMWPADKGLSMVGQGGSGWWVNPDIGILSSGKLTMLYPPSFLSPNSIRRHSDFSTSHIWNAAWWIELNSIGNDVMPW